MAGLDAVLNFGNQYFKSIALPKYSTRELVCLPSLKDRRMNRTAREFVPVFLKTKTFDLQLEICIAFDAAECNPQCRLAVTQTKICIASTFKTVFRGGVQGRVGQ